jgi:uncharacterized membrane protein
MRILGSRFAQPSRFAGASRIAGGALIVVLLAAPVAAHLALVLHRGIALAGVLIAVQGMLIAWIASSWIRPRLLRVGACGLVFVGVLLLSRFTGGGPVVAAAVPHAMAYLALLALFAASLQPGREAVITILARRSRGYLPADVVRYTRRVTLAWCGFFVAQLLGSLGLLLLAPLQVWSLFINLCNLPLVGVMLCAEYGYRQWRHAARPPERLSDMFRIVRTIRTAQVGEDR